MDLEYQHKKEKIKQNTNEAFEKVNESEQNLRNIRDLTEEGLEQVHAQKEKLRKMRDFFDKMPDSTHHTPSQETHEYMDTLASLMGFTVQYVSHQNEVINNTSHHLKGVYASSTVTSVMLDSSFNVIPSDALDFAKQSGVVDLKAMRLCASFE